MWSIAVDTGGTFTDITVSDGECVYGPFKASTNVSNPELGVVEGLKFAASQLGRSLEQMLGECDRFTYATTKGTNAVLEHKLPRVALLTTEGHRDLLNYREGGKPYPHDWSMPYPKPLVPRFLTVPVAERILATGDVRRPLAESDTRRTVEGLRNLNVDAVAVCLLWSVVNPVHELRIGAQIEEIFGADYPYSLSHVVNPNVREFRRASTTVLDAALKPLMREHLTKLAQHLREAGFSGQPLAVSHVSGGVLTFEEMMRTPVFSVDSGPALAPVGAAAMQGAKGAAAKEPSIVVDTGGTSFDVSLIRAGEPLRTHEKWVGRPGLGAMTGLPAVDTRSIGSGGGSIAKVDSGGLLQVGPESAGAQPGPACYGNGGTMATVTDAAVVLGYIDSGHFLDGRMALDEAKAAEAIDLHVARPLSMSVPTAAAAILDLVTESMRGFIVDVAMEHGLDPRDCTLIAGGGAAGLNALRLGAELESPQVLLPRMASVFSAFGGQFADVIMDFYSSWHTTTANFDTAGVTTRLDQLRTDAERFIRQNQAIGSDATISFSCQARYLHQAWELEIPVAQGDLGAEGALGDVVNDFHSEHERLFALAHTQSPVEFLAWQSRATISVPNPARVMIIAGDSASPASGGAVKRTRSVYMNGVSTTVPVVLGVELTPGEMVHGPAILEEPSTSVVIPPGAVLSVGESFYEAKYLK